MTATTSDNANLDWGEWMGSWKQSVDEETERIDRQKAAFGGDTVARIKDLNVLICGLQGVGVETAKNLILSNVGSLTLWDPTPTTMADLGTNFYLNANHVGNRRDTSCIADLKSLNPFCKVEVLEGDIMTIDKGILCHPNVSGTGKGYAAVVVTSLQVCPNVLHLNEICRQHHIAFILACNHGVTTTLFSDFGPHHEITDPFGEPTKLLAASQLEVFDEKPALLQIDGFQTSDPVVLLTVAQADHGLDNGDTIVLEDMRGALEEWNGKKFQVKRVAFQSPTAAKVNAQDVTFQEILKQPTSAIVSNFTKQYDFYQQTHQGQESNQGKKLPTRTITMFNRVALCVSKEDLPTGMSELSELEQAYDAGGLLQQVRPPVVESYSSLQETLEQTPVPQMLRGEDWEAGKGIEIHLCIAAMLNYHKEYQSWPHIHNVKHAQQFLELVKRLSQERRQKQKEADGSASYCHAQEVSFGFPTGDERDLDETRVLRFARLFGTELTGLCAFLGGAAAQEVLKKTGKFTPIKQWIHHDEQILVADDISAGSAAHNNNHVPLFGSRYDHQIAILGKDFQSRAANQKVFLVGCGALGCEYLKGLALMGVATGRHGHIYVTDMDRIEVSNLSRQFLFRDSDVGSPKSVSGARVVKGWNPQMNITALEKKVGGDTEDFFDDSFWESLDVCWNALDNVMARQYTDARCLLYSKPLLESGTLGTKCNHEVILPYRTSTYNDGKESDDNENQIAMCTLRSFPYLPLHCIEFAKQAYFSDYFEFGPDQYETFRKDVSGFFEQLDAMEPGEQLKSLRMIKSYIDTQQQPGYTDIQFGDCVKIAFGRMMDDFRTSVLNLCHSADAIETSTGKKFWTGTKRRPRPVDWTAPTPELMEYLYCTSNMYAVVWGIEPIRDRASFQKIVDDLQLKQPEWIAPSQNVDLSENDDDAAANGGDVEAEAEKLKADLYAVDTSTLKIAHPHDFEKDDDSNFHVDFLTVATNLRAWNYDIKASQRHQVKVTAGRIIPALATTTAMVCGLVDIEFCKLVMGLQCLGREKFLNSNINLAAGSGNFTTFSPDPPIPLKTGLHSPLPEVFTSWDKISLAFGPGQEMTVEQLVEYVKKTFGVTVDRIFAHGDTQDKALYSAVDQQKLEWDITIDEQGKPHVSEGVFTQWPQIRMAVQMLGRLPPTSGQRKVFENQIHNVKGSLDKTKEGFNRLFHGSVSEAFRTVYRPTDEEGEKQEYFDRVFGKRDYVLLGLHCQTSDNPDIHLPCIKYSFAPASSSVDKMADGDDEEQAQKRMRVEEKP